MRVDDSSITSDIIVLLCWRNLCLLPGSMVDAALADIDELYNTDRVEWDRCHKDLQDSVENVGILGQAIDVDWWS